MLIACLSISLSKFLTIRPLNLQIYGSRPPPLFRRLAYEASLPHRLVRENGHPPWNRGGVDEIEVHSLRAVLEEAPPLREQDWVNQDSILFNEVVFQQAVHEGVAAINDQVLTGLLLALAEAPRPIAYDQM